MNFRITDKIYPQRSYMYDGKFVSFVDYHADVPANIAYRMSRISKPEDFEIIDQAPAPFNPDSWKKEKRIIWSCNIASASGFGSVTENVILSLLRKGVNVLNPGSISGDIIHGGEFVDKEVHKSMYQIIEPDCLEIQYCQPPSLKFGIVQRIWTYAMFETNHTPKTWIDLLNKVERIIVPTTWLVKSWKDQGVKRPISVFHHGIDPKIYSYIDRPVDRKKFTFLQYGELDLRKGTDITFRAFAEEFKGQKDVQLVLKTNRAGIVGVPLDYPNLVIHRSVFSKKQMRDLLYEADCFVFPTRGEGFGLPPLEAMACFPYKTLVDSDTSIEDILEKDYDGDLITIEAENGKKVTCTTNHPFLTNKGFTKAENLSIMDVLYTKLPTSHEKQTMDKRRIGDIVKIHSSSNKKNNGVSSREDIQRNNVQDKNDGLNQVQLRYFRSNKIFFESLRNLLSSRNNRRRRDIDIQKEQRENSSSFTSSKYKHNTNKLVTGKIQRSQESRTSSKKFRDTKNTILVLLKRLANPPSFEGITSLSLDEKRALWHFDLFYREPFESEIQKKLLTIRNRLLFLDPTIEQARIVKITRKHYKGKVYNLSTADGTYWAENFLVHNTGLPTILTNWSGPADFGDPDDTFFVSHKMKRAYQFDIIYKTSFAKDENSGDWAEPSYEEVRHYMRWCYEHRSEAREKGKKAAERIRKYWTWDYVVKNELVPLLNEML